MANIEETQKVIQNLQLYRSPESTTNQSCMCSEGVGLGLFPSDSLESQSDDFDEIAHIKP